MGKYIDADRLRAEIEKTYNLEIRPWLSGVSATSAIYDYVLPLIDSLQQEPPELPNIERAEYYYHKGLYEGFSQGHADALKILDEFAKRKADPVIVIKQQEQPDSPSLIERSIVWFENIAANAKRLSAGNVSHLGPTIVGMAIRSKEFLEKHKQDQPEVDLDEEPIRIEFRTIADKCFNEGIEGWEREKLIASHFFNLDLNARKEENK